jgi:hypothetical protein
VPGGPEVPGAGMGRRRRSLSWYAYQLPPGLDDEDAGPGPKRPQVRLGRWVDGGRTLWRPCQEVYRLVDGAWQGSTEDLLPGYVLSGVFGRRPAEVIGSLLARLVSGAPVSRAEVRRLEEHESTVVHYSGTRLKVGDRAFVRFDARSSFAGLEGKIVGFEAAPGELYAHLVLDVYGTPRDVWLGADQVERLARRGRRRWRGGG